MIELTVAQIAEIVGGAVADISPQDAAHRRVTGTVEFDSRAIGPGGLFLALPGARQLGILVFGEILRVLPQPIAGAVALA